MISTHRSSLERRMEAARAAVQAIQRVGHPDMYEDPKVAKEKREVMLRLQSLEIAAKVARIGHVSFEQDSGESE